MDPPSETPPAIDAIDRASMDAMIHDSRLSIPSIFRIPLASTLSFVVGMGLGTAHGSQMAGLQFRAEHAHKLPATPTGWFLYHKSKNYHVANGGIREGFKMGAKLSVVTTATFAIENMFDTYRGTKDFVNTVIACVTVAGGFSLWSRFCLRKPNPAVRGRRDSNDDTFLYRSIFAANRCTNHQVGSAGRTDLWWLAGFARRRQGQTHRVH